MIGNKFKILFFHCINVFLFIIILGFIIKFIPLLLFGYSIEATRDKDYIKVFEEREADFEIIKDKLLEISKKYPDATISIYSDRIEIFKNGKEQINPNDDESNTYIRLSRAIYEANHHSSLTDIYYDGERINFALDGNWYRYAYIINGKKPKYMLRKDENMSFKLFKLKDNWYYFRSK